MGTSLFEEEFTMYALSQMGNPLEMLSKLVDFEKPRTSLEDVLIKKDSKTPAGRPRIVVVLMFKVIFLQRYCSLGTISNHRPQQLPPVPRRARTNFQKTGHLTVCLMSFVPSLTTRGSLSMRENHWRNLCRSPKAENHQIGEQTYSISLSYQRSSGLFKSCGLSLLFALRFCHVIFKKWL